MSANRQDDAEGIELSEELLQSLRDVYYSRPWDLSVVVDDQNLAWKEPAVALFVFSEHFDEPVLIYKGLWFDLPSDTLQELAGPTCKKLKQLGIKCRADYAARQAAVRR